MLAGRTYGIADLQLSGDVPEIEIIRAMLGITIALLGELDDDGPRFLQVLGAEAAGYGSQS